MNVIGNFEFCVYIDPLLLIFICFQKYKRYFLFLSSIYSVDPDTMTRRAIS